MAPRVADLLPLSVAASSRLAGAVARVRPGVAVLLLVALAAGVRGYGLDSKSLWLDEAWSVYAAGLPLGAMVELVEAHDTAPPLYYALLQLWMVAGDSPLVVRSLSLVLGVGTVPMTYLVGRRVGGHSVGVVSSLLASLSPFLVWYSQEARMYSLLALLCGISTWAVLSALDTGRIRWWALYALSSFLALLTQMVAVFFVVGQGFAALVFILTTEKPSGGWRDARSSFVGLFASSLLALLAWLPWLPSFLRQSQTYEEFWIGIPTYADLINLFSDLASAYLPHWQLPFSREILVVLCAALVVSARKRIARREWAFLVSLLLIPALMLFAASFFKPLFVSRALIFLCLPYLVLLAAGALSARPRRLGPALISVLILLNLLSLSRVYWAMPKEEWSAATSYVMERAAPGSLVLFLAPTAQLPFQYYARGQESRLEYRGVPQDLFSVSQLEPRVSPSDLPRLDNLLSGREAFWLVESHAAFSDPAGLVRESLEGRYAVGDKAEFYGISLRHYARSPR